MKERSNVSPDWRQSGLTKIIELLCCDYISCCEFAAIQGVCRQVQNRVLGDHASKESTKSPVQYRPLSPSGCFVASSIHLGSGSTSKQNARILVYLISWWGRNRSHRWHNPSAAGSVPRCCVRHRSSQRIQLAWLCQGRWLELMVDCTNDQCQ